MFDTYEAAPDVMAMSAVQHIHGIDLVYTSDTNRYVAHGGPGRDVHDVARIRSELARWHDRCAAYDADAEQYRRQMRQRRPSLTELT